jgi:DNA-binding MarR family transcriptional regulator
MIAGDERDETVGNTAVSTEVTTVRPEAFDAVEEATGLRVAIVRIQRQLRVGSGSDITPSQSSALARIEQDGPLRLGALAELEGTTPATISRVVDSLSDRHLIERVPDPLDGRASLVRLSDEGGAVLHDLRARYTEVLRGAIAELSEGERRVMRESIPVLTRLSELLQATERVEVG